MGYCNVDTLLARAQVALAFFCAAGFIGFLYVLVFHTHEFTSTELTLITTVLGVLGTIVTQQSAYFFARHRSNTPVDPSPSDTAPVPTSISVTKSTTTGDSK